MTPRTSCLLYTDESGNEDFTVHTSVVVPVDRWAGVLKTWLKYREFLTRRYQVPKEFHMHSHQWIPAKDKPVDQPEPRNKINVDEGLRRQLTVKALKTMSNSELAILTTHWESPRQEDGYINHLAEIDAYFTAHDCWGTVVLDGQYKDGDKRLRVHRDLVLDTRRIVEDAWVQPAKGSQLMQMADLAVHCAFQMRARNPVRDFMHSWYSEILHDKEVDTFCVCED